MAEESDTELAVEQEETPIVAETDEDKSARLSAENDDESAAAAEAAKKEAALQKKRNDRLAAERSANLARVQFKEPVVKHIVSHHMSSIMAAADPSIKISDEVYSKVQSTFVEFTSSGATEGEGEGEDGEGKQGDAAEDCEEGDAAEDAETAKSTPEPSIPYDHNTLAKMLFQCGLTPIEFNASEMGAPSGRGNGEETEEDGGAEGEEDAAVEGIEGEEGGDEETEAVDVAVPHKGTTTGKSKSQRLIDLVKLYALDTLTPDRPITESTFIDFVHKFYAPAYYYGQHLRRYAGRGCIEEVLDLFARGCNVNTSDGEGLSALHYASEFNRVELIEAMSIFAGKSLEVNGKDKAGWTPLYCAVHHGNMEVVKLLLKMPASDSARDSISKITTIHGKTALHACAAQGRLEIAEFLLKQPETNLKLKDQQGLTALHQAAFSGETLVYNLLLSDSKCDNKLVGMRESLKYTADTYMEEKNGAKGLDSSLYEDTVEMSEGASAVFGESKSEAKSDNLGPVDAENDTAEEAA